MFGVVDCDHECWMLFCVVRRVNSSNTHELGFGWFKLQVFVKHVWISHEWCLILLVHLHIGRGGSRGGYGYTHFMIYYRLLQHDINQICDILTGLKLGVSNNTKSLPNTRFKQLNWRSCLYGRTDKWFCFLRKIH